MTVNQSAPDGMCGGICDNFTRCGGLSMHTILLRGETRKLCCYCYVTEGNPPADWHPYCMETWNRLEAEKLHQQSLRPEFV